MEQTVKPKSKKIVATLSEKAQNYYNEVKYSLAKNSDGSGIATDSQCINWMLEMAADVEKFVGGEDITRLFRLFELGKEFREKGLNDDLYEEYDTLKDWFERELLK